MLAVAPKGAVVHSAALARDNRSLLFLAPSGGGKSTIAKSLLRRGWRVIGDDSVIVAEGTDGAVRTLPCGVHRMKTGEYDIAPAELRGIVFLEKGPSLLIPVASEYCCYRAERIDSLLAADEVSTLVLEDARAFLCNLFLCFPAAILRREADDGDERLIPWLQSL